MTAPLEKAAGALILLAGEVLDLALMPKELQEKLAAALEAAESALGDQIEVRVRSAAAEALAEKDPEAAVAEAKRLRERFPDDPTVARALSFAVFMRDG